MIDLHYEYWNRKTHYPCLHDKKTRDSLVHKIFSARKDYAFREDQWNKKKGPNVFIIALLAILGLILWRCSICVYFIYIHSSLYAQQRRETDRH